MISRYIVSLLSLALVILTSACGDTFDTKDLGATAPPDSYGDTSYVLKQPIWTGFIQPADIHVGFEPFIYVSERGADRVTMLDLSGRIIGSSASLRHPDAITQDHRLDLLVCGEFDTTIDGRAVTFGAIYRIELVKAKHSIANAAVRRIYFDPLNQNRRFTGIAILPDNSYYVTRTGPSNNSPVDPDDAIMLFGANDEVRPRVEWPGLSVDGTGLATLTQPTSIATFSRPSSDFVFTQSGPKSLFRTQWITQRTTGDVAQWESYYTPARDGDLDFLRVSLFDSPEDVAIDDAGNIYVIDAGRDSLFQFNPSGFITQAFGGPTQFASPEGVAYFDRTLYIADTQNNRIMRFVLSTDLR
ncbi:MAG: hypothetical protein WAV84_17320 [Bacteroidota bacterium]